MHSLFFSKNTFRSAKDVTSLENQRNILKTFLILFDHNRKTKVGQNDKYYVDSETVNLKAIL